ncbi:MAG: metallophosphoesterase [Gemmatimonadota bacterium]|nr:metallophosphoesterase [Gemmatimonadota bacterium]
MISARHRLLVATLITLAPIACRQHDTGSALISSKVDPARDSIALAMQSDSVPTLVGAGDIADCASNGAVRTAALLDSLRGTIFIAGDVAYVSKENPHPFVTCFDPAWGRHRARIRPAVGNHEYSAEGPAAYFDYFGAQAGPRPGGYYSYDLGTWHVIALNTNIAADAGSPQQVWLQSDLDAHLGRCTIAYMHHPRFSSGSHAERDKLIPLWRTFERYGVSVVVAGHDHLYERFAPLDTNGVPDSVNGIRQFVVGTGGAHRSSIGSVLSGSEVHDTDTFGLIRFSLLKDHYRWQFIPVKAKGFRDQGEDSCHPTHAAG